MKFVFALALVALYVALMGARPNMDVHQRAVRDVRKQGGVSSCIQYLFSWFNRARYGMSGYIYVYKFD